jgi:putative drug exporter of the RND superfamily
MFGVGLGLAILIDVLIVRMVIAPAVVTLLGDRAWWLPAWMDRALPNVSLEGRREIVEAEPERAKVPVASGFQPEAPHDDAPDDDAPESPPVAIPVAS